MSYTRKKRQTGETKFGSAHSRSADQRSEFCFKLKCFNTDHIDLAIIKLITLSLSRHRLPLMYKGFCLPPTVKAKEGM